MGGEGEKLRGERGGGREWRREEGASAFAGYTLIFLQPSCIEYRLVAICLIFPLSLATLRVINPSSVFPGDCIAWSLCLVVRRAVANFHSFCTYSGGCSKYLWIFENSKSSRRGDFVVSYHSYAFNLKERDERRFRPFLRLYGPGYLSIAFLTLGLTTFLICYRALRTNDISVKSPERLICYVTLFMPAQRVEAPCRAPIFNFPILPRNYVRVFLRILASRCKVGRSLNYFDNA